MSDLMEYKCPCCGGGIEFNSDVQRMKCPYCDTEFDIATLQAYDEELKKESEPREDQWEKSETQWEQGETDGMYVYLCNSCGGEVIADQTTAATHCPFCGNPDIMKDRFAGDLRPDYISPFKLDKETAKQMLKQHFKGKRLLPKAFKNENHIDEIKGVYVPFWLFDANVRADLRYRGTRVRRWSDSRYVYTETSYFAIMRGGDIAFDHVPADGSTKMADDLMESLEPFDFSQAVPFTTAYLSGYLADRYDVLPETCLLRANERIDRSTKDAFASTIHGFATVTPEGGGLNVQNGKAKYALYPVWLLTTSWKGKSYLFAMNGQTGKFVGDLPVDKGAWWRWFLGLTGIIGGILSAILVLIDLM